MKNLLLIFSLSFILSGCSTLEIEAATSSEDITQEILAKGLTHEENLKEASKLNSPHLVKIVTLKLKNDRDEKIQAVLDAEKSDEFANNVKVSEDNNRFVSIEINESIQSGILSTDIDLLNYYLEGSRDLENNILKHKFHLSLVYNSNASRNYHSISFCDKWNNCDESTEVKVIEVSVSNCKKNNCDYKELFEINLSDDFLKNTLKEGFSMRLISEQKTNTIKLSKAYLMGYLQAAQ